MGYEFHITRADAWLDRSEAPISEEEWAALVASEALLVEGGRDLDGRVAGHCWRDSDGAALWWNDGEILVKGPRSDAELGEIVAVAERLGARLFGDDDEEYARDGSPMG